MTKRCRVCGDEKLLADFYVHARDGVVARCKACMNAAQRAVYRKNLTDSRQRGAHQQAEHRRRHPERFTKEARREQRQKAYERNRHTIIARSRQWRRAHPKASWLMVKRWMQKSAENRQRFLHGKLVREARRRDRGGHVTLKPSEVLSMLEAQHWQCAYCPASLRETNYHLEHRTPLSRGGRSTRDNLCMACASCNLRKHTQTAEEFTAA